MTANESSHHLDFFMGFKSSSTNEVVVTVQVPQSRIRTKEIIRLGEAILKYLGHRRTSLGVAFVSDRKIKDLNRRFLRHSWLTDVLAFPFTNPRLKTKNRSSRLFIGEVIISPEQARIQATDFNATVNEELARYLCHGILHLSGYRDRTLREKKAMRHQEDHLLRRANRYVKRIL